MSGKARTIRPIVPKVPIRDNHDEGSSVKKQKKSRHGCVTCKSKRMKCDETKPACYQCTRRRLTCGGYAGTRFKWKQFVNPEEGLQSQEDEPAIPSTEQIVVLSNAKPRLSRGDTKCKSTSNCFHKTASSLPYEEGHAPESGEMGSVSGDHNFDWLDQTETTEMGIDQTLFGSFPSFGDHNMEASLHFSSIDGFSGRLNELDPHEMSCVSPIQEEFPLYSPISLDTGHEDVIAALFQRKTCLVLSVKDDCNDNPWRSLIWPLAKKHPALSHAISAMTCLQQSTTRADLHSQGLDHLQKSISIFRQELESGVVKFDAALATTLALCLAKTWEAPRTTTGFEYLNESKLILKRAVACMGSPQISPRSAERLSFLANTWIYLDVMSRLTSSDLGDNIDIDLIMACNVLNGSFQRTKIDPLMGSAVDLFPLIGRAADIVKKVWVDNSRRDAPAVVSEAAEIMRAVEIWTPSLDSIAQAEPGFIVTDSLQTAEAYRWATILLLRQAVPALPSLSTLEDIAQKVLVYLATVPMSSGMTITHLFPLLIAGCEVVGREEREWVKERWKLMSGRMITGIVNRCLEWTTEAWRRKDQLSTTTDLSATAEQHSENSSPAATATSVDDVEEFFNAVIASSDNVDEHKEMPIVSQHANSAECDKILASIVPPMKEKLTKPVKNAIRIRLNWYAVMHDWKWNVMLG